MTNSEQGMIGRLVGGRYKVEKIIGRGGMAEVFKARQESLDRDVAIKVMHNFLAADGDFAARFQREARAIATLRHPNIVQVYDFDTDNNLTYMVMEYIDGPTLKDIIEDLKAEGKVLPTSQAIEVIRSVGLALDYAHRKGMIHRDVKPANVMRDSGGRVILTDFGIAKILAGPQYTATGSMVGTPSYMAPEQGLGQPGDARTDIYSLGVMLYQLVTGRLPFESDTPMAVVFKHINDPLPLPSTINPEMPPEIEKVILKALAKDPEERYQSARELVEHLTDLSKAKELTVPASTLTGLKVGGSASTTMAGQTKIGQSGTPTVVVKPEGDSTTPKKGGGIGKWIGLGAAGLLVLLLGGSVLAAFSSGLLAFSPPETATITPTNTPAGTPTDDPFNILLTERSVERTEAAIQSTALEATLSAALATETPTPTPNLTATADACTYDYRLGTVNPANGSNIPVNSTVELEIPLTNIGTCPWPADLTLNHVSGFTPAEAQVPVGALAVNTTTNVTFAFNAGTTAGTNELVLNLESASINKEFGDPLTFSFSQIVLPTNTPRPPVATAPPAATATPAPQPTQSGGTPLTGGVSLSFFSCDYAAPSGGGPRTDYVCSVNVNFSGGVAPWTVIVSGGGDAQFQVPNDTASRFTSVRGRRCLVIQGTIRVIDSTGAEINGTFFFDPLINQLFPPSNQNVCGLGD